MRNRPPDFLIGWLSAVVLACAGPRGLPAEEKRPATPYPAEAVAYFEAKVRPVLVDACLKCHDAKKQSSGLRLDSREAILEGGLNGPSIVPGQPDESLLVQAVRHSHDDVKMPPKGKLPAPAVEALASWVRMGAPWSDKPILAAGEKDRAAQAHWAFRPVRRTDPPPVANRTWVRSPIDAFILARLEAEGITPAPPADKRTLIRRATFDLTGLPPTPEEVAAFEADASPDAFARVVDRLLASPRYGERWGRHWLDVARYADTKGYVFQEERRYPYSYTYRDYVIAAFNEDRPYDRFVLEQLAADRLPLGPDTRPLAALGFLTVGRRFLNNQQDILDDRIDVVSRGLLGLTVACARCHDHKYDPIPTEDYYSLYGVFASSIEPAELPALASPTPSPETLDFQAKLREGQRKVDACLDEAREEVLDDWRENVAVYFRAAFDLGFNPGHEKLDERAKADGLGRPRLRLAVLRWRDYLAATQRAGHDPVFAPWHALAAVPPGELARKAPEVLKALGRAKPPADPVVLHALAARPPATMADVAARYAALFAEADTRWQERDPGRESERLADPGWEDVRRVVYGADGPLALPGDLARRALDRTQRNKLTGFTKAVEALKATHPGAPPRAMVVNDAPNPVNPVVFLRGNPGRPGKPVPRRFLAVLAGKERTPFKEGSGRLELAKAIARGDNPLTARVMVNRIWQHHFGEGLVATPSDFGLRSDPPSHPELLDWLADAFVRSGWSVKTMHRLIMLSSVYAQSADNPHASAVAERDPRDRLLWKFGRRRLDFEELRDTILAASGRLDPAMGGRPVPIAEPPYPPRRTVYGFIDRQNLDGVYRAFDFASPDASSPRRFVTTVPQQALFLMNSPFVVEQARALADRVEAAPGDDGAKVRRLYRLLFEREPTPDELGLGTSFIRGQSALDTAPTPAWRLGWGEVDEATHRVARVEPFAHWTGAAWQFGPKLPDPKGAFAHLTADGGHVGEDLRHAVIRRWTAPHDATIAIEGALGHEGKGGDGVRGRVIASRGGELGAWVAERSKAPTPVNRYEVKRGETIDFVVDCRTTHDFDGFTWAPVVRQLSPAPSSWNAHDEFQGPPPPALRPWGQYAQVLLLTNEFMFVD